MPRVGPQRPHPQPPHPQPPPPPPPLPPIEIPIDPGATDPNNKAKEAASPVPDESDPPKETRQPQPRPGDCTVASPGSTSDPSA
mgnify:CR=1 FL=1